MTGEVIIQNAKILNIVEKQSDDGQIHWVEIVYMQGSNVNTVTINRNVSEELTVGEVFDLLLQITEVIKSTRSGGAYKSHKFKITGAFPIDD